VLKGGEQKEKKLEEEKDKEEKCKTEGLPKWS
jgi:hypothetical protein